MINIQASLRVEEGEVWSLQEGEVAKKVDVDALWGTIGGCAVLGVGWRYMYLEPRSDAGIGLLRWRGRDTCGVVPCTIPLRVNMDA